MPFSSFKGSATSKQQTTEKAKGGGFEDDEGYVEPKFPIRRYEYVEGRNFRQSTSAKGPFLPCDDEEIERLQVNFLLFKSLFGRIYFSPMEETLKRGARVLDVGAGPGLWIRDMAEQYPNSHFTGTDAMIYPISTPPKNCQLRIADAAEGLPFPDNTFDFVLQHDGLMRYTHSEWDMAIKELVRVLKPGGWIELVECSCALQDIGPNLSIWLMRLTVSLQSRNINVKMASQLNRYLEKAGSLENVEFSHRSVPIGWLGKLGDLMLECMERLFDSMKPRLCEDWSMSLSKYDKIVQAASKECREFKSWTNVHYAYGRKL